MCGTSREDAGEFAKEAADELKLFFTFSFFTCVSMVHAWSIMNTRAELVQYWGWLRGTKGR